MKFSYRKVKYKHPEVLLKFAVHLVINPTLNYKPNFLDTVTKAKHSFSFQALLEIYS